MSRNIRKTIILLKLTILYLLAYCVIIISPIRTKLISLFILFSPITYLLVLLFILRKKLILKIIGSIVIVFTIILFSLKNRCVSIEEIRNTYVIELIKYENTRYVWGGENINGIDCSGLVRKGMINALFKLGVRNLSSKYLYEAFKIYINDFSAKSIKEEYKNMFTKLLEIDNLNTFDHSQIMAGDILVTSNGVHTFAYVGNNKWIQADPGSNKVIVEAAPSKNNQWYEMKSVILRWKYFY